MTNVDLQGSEFSVVNAENYSQIHGYDDDKDYVSKFDDENNETINDINSVEKKKNELLIKTTEISKLQSISENSQLRDEIVKLKAKIEELSHQEKIEFSQQINDFQIFESSIIKELEMIDEIETTIMGKYIKFHQKSHMH